MQMPWYVAAIGAALVWGLHYPLVDFALRRLSLVSVLVLTALPVVLLVPFCYQTLRADVAAWQALPAGERLTILALSLTSLAGAWLLFLSISGKNATLAALIEISYPLFVALFAFLLFRQTHLTPATALGGLLVLAGVALIIRSSP